MGTLEKTSELNGRRRQLLDQTVGGYIQHGEPVGSKWLSETSGLSVSPATIRNDLNDLEKDGYLTQLHLSSGRVPTDKGYRAYVDGVINRVAPSDVVIPGDVQLVGHGIQQILGQVTDLMGNLIDYTTIVMMPDVYQETLKLAHLILVDLDKVMVVLLNKVGVNREFLVQISDRVDQEDLNKISRLLTEKLSGRPAFEWNTSVAHELAQELPRYQGILAQITSEIQRLRRINSGSDKLMMRGVSNMIRLPEFRNVELTQRVLATLEETKVMLAVFSEYMARNQPQVVIGDEHTIDELKDCSIVAAPYLVNDEPIGVVGVLGPRRMAYERIIPMVNGITSRITDYLSSTQTSTEGDMTND
ncbi:heat-inducible transcription repressor HrcA [bacterium]|nr:heat-inducible transcription repressor HrcA [bacterium]